VRGSITADSTVSRADYIGPDACGQCHADQHARWKASLHATMNQRASATTILGRDATLAYAGGTFTFDRASATMTLAKGDTTIRYKVTRTIGTKGLQEYVGVAEGGNDEVRLPFAWWPRRAGWYPQPYFDPWLPESAFDAYTEVKEPWAERCPWCHSTYPFAQRIARASRPRGAGHGLEQHFEATPAADDRLRVEHQVTVGISCESCHLGGRAHAAGAPIHFIPIGATPRAGAPAPTKFQTERADPAIANRVCAQCHSGPSPRFPNGAATRNSSEALDLAASPCIARCADCHDPHRGGGGDKRANTACVTCHAKRADPAHAGRGHATVGCVDCHMPRIVMGIDRHVRTHRIGRPTDRRMLAAGGPNACNLCHLDRTIRWTVDELRRGYEVRFDPSGWPYRDDDGVGETYLASKEPAVRLIAASAYARSPFAKSALRDLARLLDDPLAYVRAWATFAIEEIRGTPLSADDYDPRAAVETRRRQLANLYKR
jgi:hypothetical protein